MRYRIPLTCSPGQSVVSECVGDGSRFTRGRAGRYPTCCTPASLYRAININGRWRLQIALDLRWYPGDPVVSPERWPLIPGTGYIFTHCDGDPCGVAAVATPIGHADLAEAD